MTLKKKTPERTCVACREKRPASQMWRFVKNDAGVLEYDHQRRASGRGANVCPEPSCLKKAIERKAFSRAFKSAVLVGEKVLLDLRIRV